MLEFFRSSAVRVAIAFVIATVVATTGIFGLVYFQIKAADQRSNRLILEDEAAKSVNHSVDELKYAFEVRLTHGLRRLDYAALFSADRKAMFGNIEELLRIPVSGARLLDLEWHTPWLQRARSMCQPLGHWHQVCFRSTADFPLGSATGEG
jgi:hypothetical protein